MGQKKASLLLRCPLFIGWKHARVVVGVGEGVLFREVSSVQIERAVTLITSVFSLNKPRCSMLSGAIHLMGTLADAPGGLRY